MSYYIIGNSLTILQILIISLLIFILGIVLFSVVEQRFTKITSNDSQSNFGVKDKVLVWSVVSLTSVILALSLMAISTDGYIFKANKNKFEKVISTLKREHIVCKERSVSLCIKKSPNARVVLIGDSNAYHFAVGAKKFSPNNEIISLALGGCMPLARFTRLEQSQPYNHRCLKFNGEVQDILNSGFPKDRVVVISAAWLLYLHGPNLDQNVPKSKLANLTGIILGDEDFNPIPNDKKVVEMRHYLIDLAEKLSKKFKRVVILGPLPPQPYAVKTNPMLQKYGHNGTSLKSFYSYADPLLEVFEEIINLNLANVDVIYPHKKLCNTFVKERCVGFFNGEHYYADKQHVSGVGQYVAYDELFRYLNDL